jgi:hypothetical protein
MRLCDVSCANTLMLLHLSGGRSKATLHTYLDPPITCLHAVAGQHDRLRHHRVNKRECSALCHDGRDHAGSNRQRAHKAPLRFTLPLGHEQEIIEADETHTLGLLAHRSEPTFPDSIAFSNYETATQTYTECSPIATVQRTQKEYTNTRDK